MTDPTTIFLAGMLTGIVIMIPIVSRARSSCIPLNTDLAVIFDDSRKLATVVPVRRTGFSIYTVLARRISMDTIAVLETDSAAKYNTPWGRQLILATTIGPFALSGQTLELPSHLAAMSIMVGNEISCRAFDEACMENIVAEVVNRMSRQEARVNISPNMKIAVTMPLPDAVNIVLREVQRMSRKIIEADIVVRNLVDRLARNVVRRAEWAQTLARVLVLLLLGIVIAAVALYIISGVDISNIFGAFIPTPR